VIAVLGIGLGVDGSLYSTEIGDAVYLPWHHHGAVSTLVFGFWVGIVVSFYLFLSAQSASRDEQRALFAATDRVQQLVQTLPPTYFRKRLAETHADAYRTLEELVPRTVAAEADDDALMVLLRSLLYGIATLALLFGDEPTEISGADAHGKHLSDLRTIRSIVLGWDSGRTRRRGR
jgi:hypothetical protein